MKGPIGCLPRYVWSPNISGSFPGIGHIDSDKAYYTGPFYADDPKTIPVNTTDGADWTCYFDPSKMSADYVTGGKVQVPALQSLVCIKA